MTPVNANLSQALNGMVASGNPDLRAQAENLLFEDRISAVRQQSYERLPPAGPSHDDWLESHGAYLKTQIHHLDVPETFRPINRTAWVTGPAHLTIDDGKELIRVESLDWALGHTKVTSLADLEGNPGGLPEYAPGNELFPE